MPENNKLPSAYTEVRNIRLNDFDVAVHRFEAHVSEKERLAKIEVLEELSGIIDYLNTLGSTNDDVNTGYKNAFILIRQKTNILIDELKADS